MVGPIPTGLVMVWVVAVSAAWLYGYVCGRAVNEDMR